MLVHRNDSYSQSRFVFLLNGGVETWRSSKKDIVVDLTIEFEYIATNEPAKDTR